MLQTIREVRRTAGAVASIIVILALIYTSRLDDSSLLVSVQMDKDTIVGMNTTNSVGSTHSSMLMPANVSGSPTVTNKAIPEIGTSSPTATADSVSDSFKTIPSPSYNNASSPHSSQLMPANASDAPAVATTAISKVGTASPTVTADSVATSVISIPFPSLVGQSINLSEYVISKDNGGLISSLHLVAGATKLSGMLFISTHSNETYVSARFIGPLVVGVQIVPGPSFEEWNANRSIEFKPVNRTADDGSLPFAHHLIARVLLPAALGSYELAIKSTKLNRTKIFHLVEPMFPWIENNEMRIPGVRIAIESTYRPMSSIPTFPADSFPPLPVVFYNLSTELKSKLSRSGFRGQGTNYAGQTVQYSFPDGRRVDRACIAKALNASTDGSVKGDTRSVCILGDSHARTLYNEIVFALSNVDYLVDGFKTIVSSTMRNPPRLQITQFPFNVAAAMAGGRLDRACRKIFTSVGIWPMSYHNINNLAPVDLLRYEQELETIFRDWKDRKRTIPQQLYWMSIEPCAASQAFTANMRDWRHESFVETWASRTADVARSFGIPVIDNYRLLQPIQELTFDGCHFTKPMYDAVTDAVIEAAYGDDFPECIVRPGDL